MNLKEYNFAGARRGAAVKTAANKTRITIRVDTISLNWFRDKVHQAGGGNYQTLINEVLREHIQQRHGALVRENVAPRSRGRQDVCAPPSLEEVPKHTDPA